MTSLLWTNHASFCICSFDEGSSKGERTYQWITHRTYTHTHHIWCHTDGLTLHLCPQMRDSLSFKSSDSDVSDVSAMSNTSDTRSVHRIRWELESACISMTTAVMYTIWYHHCRLSVLWDKRSHDQDISHDSSLHSYWVPSNKLIWRILVNLTFDIVSFRKSITSINYSLC